MEPDDTISAIEETATAPEIAVTLSGVPEGTIEKDMPQGHHVEHRERVVHETDSEGNVIGWHKESVTEGE